MDEQRRRLYQCPGCWSYVLAAVPKDGWIECDCGEAMTLVDLREQPAAVAGKRATND